MSTKISHGYRLAAGTDVLEFTDQLRVALNPVRDALDARMLAARAVELVDQADRAGTARPAMPLLDAVTGYETEQQGLPETSRQHDPHRFEVALGRDPVTGRILCLLYAEAPQLVEAWEQMPQVEPYGYQNSTDRPADVSATEWEERRAAWARLLPDYEAPANRTLTFTLRARDLATLSPFLPGVQDPIKLEQLHAHAPTLADRSGRLVQHLALSQALSARPGLDPSAAMRLVMRVVANLRKHAPTDALAAAGRALHDDVVDYALADHGTQDVRPVDLTETEELVSAWVAHRLPAAAADA